MGFSLQPCQPVDAANIATVIMTAWNVTGIGVTVGRTFQLKK